jgi:hypothetical protein
MEVLTVPARAGGQAGERSRAVFGGSERCVLRCARRGGVPTQQRAAATAGDCTLCAARTCDLAPLLKARRGQAAASGVGVGLTALPASTPTCGVVVVHFDAVLLVEIDPGLLVGALILPPLLLRVRLVMAGHGYVF